MPVESPDDEDWQKDHRQRLRERFFQGGQSAVPDYEILEMVLYSAIRRSDTKPLAKRLLAEFGDLGSVLSADSTRLKQTKGVGDAVVAALKTVEAAAHRMMQTKVMNRCVLSSWPELIDYCTTAMAHRSTEHFRILFLDQKNILIADEAQQKGTINHVPVYPREIVKRALEINAVALILVHNHPSGDPTPSTADIEMTHAIAAAADALGVRVHDHIVIGKQGHISFRATGLL